MVRHGRSVLGRGSGSGKLAWIVALILLWTKWPGRPAAAFTHGTSLLSFFALLFETELQNVLVHGERKEDLKKDASRICSLSSALLRYLFSFFCTCLRGKGPMVWSGRPGLVASHTGCHIPH